MRVIAVEPAACPSLTKGMYAYDFGDTGQLTPLVKMHTLGHTFVPAGIPRRRPALPRHGAAGQPPEGAGPDRGARRTRRPRCFEAGVQFARAEGIVPAPEANHAVKATIDEALRCKEAGESKVILFNLCGHGHFDMQAYIDYCGRQARDHDYSEEEVAMALAGLPSVAV